MYQSYFGLTEVTESAQSDTFSTQHLNYQPTLAIRNGDRC